MASDVVVNQNVLVNFAQKLAGNEKRIRDVALKKLRKWLQNRSQAALGGFTDDDLLKIWKGLHYSMWMQDKPLIQEELADSLSQLVHTFKQEKVAFRFLDILFQTEAREWNLIDYYRLDKFMMLIRRSFNQGLVLVKKQHWQTGSIGKFTGIFLQGLIKGKDDRLPDGLKFHLADLYLTELTKVGGEELSTKQVHLFLEPYCLFLSDCRNKALVKHVTQRVFQELVTQAVAAKEEEEEEDEDEDDNEEKTKTIRLKVDYERLGDRLFEVASGPSCLGRNRAGIYSLVKKFKNLAQGLSPEEEELSSGGEEHLTSKDINRATNRLVAFENKVIRSQKDPEKTKRKKKKPSTEEDGEEDNEEPIAKKSKKHPAAEAIEEDADSDAQVKQKKKKQKKKKDTPTAIPSPQKVSTSEEVLSTEANTPGGKKKKKRKQEQTPEIQIDSNLLNGDSPVPVESAKKQNKNKLRESLPNGHETPTRTSEKASSKKKGRKSFAEEETVTMVTCQDDSATEASSKKKKHKRKSTGALESPLSPSENLTRSAKKTGEAEKKKHKRKSAGGSEFPPSPDENSTGSAKKTGEAANSDSANKSKKKRKSLNVSEGSDKAVLEEEVEIWIPNKKYKGKFKDAQENVKSNSEDGLSLNISAGETLKGKSAGQTFAQFEKAPKVPTAAFVRRAMGKLSPKSEPRVASKKMSKVLKAPGSAPNSGKKKVLFVMNQNKAQDYHEYRNGVNGTPQLPFDPQVTPGSGILKTPIQRSPEVTTPKKQLFKNSKKRRSAASDFF